MTLHPAVAAVRLAVRRELTDRLGAGSGQGPARPVMVACSGGADSLALLAATVFEAAKLDVRVIGVVVDHGLQERSAEHTAAVVQQMATLGADETATIRVTVDPGPRGIEAAAREARYAVLEQLAAHFGAAELLLGHTRDDQAETVLLGLTRGAGGRSLAGMRRGWAHPHPDGTRTWFGRPLLDLTREQTRSACRAEGIEWWEDPHNRDPGFLRVRVRQRVLPVLEAELGPGVAAALARTADQLRLDTAFLDATADAALAAARLPGAGESVVLSVPAVAGQDPAIRTRVLRLAAVAAGAVPAELFHRHVMELDRLVTDWHGQKWIDLPGHVRALRAGDELRFAATRPDPD